MRKLLVIVLLSAACFAQSFSTSGQFSATGQLLAPAPSTPPTILPAIGFGMHVHSPTVIQPTFPFDAYRIWGTSCQWDTIETAAATFNWSCIDQWIAFANTNNVDLIFTFGQLPLFLSTINPDAGNSPFPVPNNGITIACVGGGCTATVTTLQRLNAALGDTLVIGSDDGSCPESLTATGGATSVNNQTDYPWTYSFPIAGGSTNSTGCGGAAITLTDNSLSATRCNGTGNPPSGQAGGCYSPADVAVDGTGNDCEFNRNSGACTGHSGFLVAFLNHLASSDPNHKFKYFEMWNEPQGAGFFNGSIAQMARMQKDAYTLIHGSSRSDIILTSPAPSGGLTSPATYLSQFCADPSQPGQYVQQWDVHTYNFPSGAAAPKPEDAMTIATNVKNVLASCPFASGKSLWASEGSWGQGQWALNGSIGPNTGTTAIADKAGWAFNSYAFHQCAGFGRFYWFALDQQCNTGLACTSPNSNQPAAYAYGLAHDIFTGSSISQTCSQDTAKNWTLGLSRAGGYSAQIVWNENLTVPGSFTIPAGTWTRYRDVTGAIHSITGLQTSVPTNYDPIILENQAPPLSITTVTLPAGIAGSAFSATLTANCPNVPCTYAERSLPSVLTANHLALNSSTGAITGTPLAAFSGSVIITIKDALGQTNNAILPLTVTAAMPLAVSNEPCPSMGLVGNNYSCTLTATGGVTPYTWTLLSGSNPDGTLLTNVANAGIVSGPLTTAATYTPTYQVTDSTTPTPQTSLAGPYSIVISSPLSICGPPGYLCTTRSTAVIQPPAAPFVSSSPVNTIAYDTSLNVSGLNPIVRATGPTTSSSSCTVTPSGSSSDNLWATDHSKVAITCGNGNFVLFFNGATMQVSGPSLAIPNSGGGMEFSRVNPNVLYTLQQASGSSGHAGAIWKTTFTGGTAFTQTLFFDPITAPGAGCATLVGKTFTSTILSVDSADANFETVAVTSGQQSVGWVAHYDITNNNCEVLDTNTGLVTLEDGTTGAASGDATLCWPIGVHAGRIFKNGLAGGFATAAIGACINAPHLWTYGTRTVRRCNSGVSPFTCGPNHDFDGYNVRVISPTVTGQGGDAQLYFYTETGTLPPPLGQYYGTIPNQNDEHFTSFGSGSNLDLNPLVGETVKLAWNGTPFTAPGEDEIFAMPRTPLMSAPFIRFAHQFASSINLCPACDFRTQNAIGSTSQDGQFLIFVSDMLLGLGSDSKFNPRQDLFIIGLDYALNVQASSLVALQGSNGSGCTANGSPDAGCNAAQTALTTTGTNTHAQTQTPDPVPGNISVLPISNYLYAGSTAKVDCYYQPWFLNSGGHNSHVNIGMDESNSATIAAQAAAMVARGCSDVVIDWYGTDASQAFNLSVADAWATYLKANPLVPLKMAIMIDKGALSPFCATGATDQTSCLITAMKAQFDYIDLHYGPGSSGTQVYALDSNGKPLVWYFIIKSAWSGTNFVTNSSGVYPQVQTYAHAHYSKAYQILDENKAGLTELGADGAYGWPQPPTYSNAAATSQLCWDDPVGTGCSWVTGVGGGVSYVNDLYTTCKATPARHCVGIIFKGFDWSNANWNLGVQEIIQQGCGNVPNLLAAKLNAQFSTGTQLERVGWATWNDYEEGHEIETGIDNCARPTASISAPNQLGWLENPTDITYFSESGTIDHWEIWYTTTGGTTLTKALGGIAPSVSTEVISSVIPAGTWDVYLYMVGKSGIINRIAGPVSYTH